jgi:hypothetical protein
MTSKSVIRRKYQQISHSLDEKNRRLWCATEALAIKKGGIAMVHVAKRRLLSAVVLFLKLPTSSHFLNR